MTSSIITLTTLTLAAGTTALVAVVQNREHIMWFAVGFAAILTLALAVLVNIAEVI